MSKTRVNLFLNILHAVLLSFSLSACGTGTLTEIMSSSKMKREIQATLSGMTLKEKSSQVLMTGIAGSTIFSSIMKNRFSRNVPGAVLLFKYNIAPSGAGVYNFLQETSRGLSEVESSLPVFIAIDHEGGDVYRTGKITSALPSAQSIAESFSPEQSLSLYSYTGAQLSLLGIHMNLAPVAETTTGNNQDFLGSRSYSNNAAIVESYSKAAVLGYRDSGIIAAVKHFPGSGKGDPHSGLTVLDVDKNTFDSVYVKPFRTLIKLKPDVMLVSHVVVPVIERDMPFCFSYKGVTGLLRKNLGFKGLILSDDISMGAIKKSGITSSQAALLALKAGCDMIMVLEYDYVSIADAIEKEAMKNDSFALRLDDAVKRIVELKYQAGLVKTAQEGYSKSVNGSAFDGENFLLMKHRAEQILEEVNDD